MKRVLALSVLAGTALLYLACGDDEVTIGPIPDDGGGVDVTPGTDGSTPGADGSTREDAGPPCAAPTDPSKAAICLYLTPEAIDFVSSDPNYDGKGILGVQAYSTPAGDDDAGVGAPVILPAQPDGGVDGGPVLMDLAEGVPMVRLDGLPVGVVFVRAVFFDSAFAEKTIRPGWWMAGMDISKGFFDSKLTPITLVAGTGTNVSFDLHALRKLTVSMSRAEAAEPAGNGQGPARSLVIDKQTADSTSKGFGVAQASCGDLSGNGAAVLEGLVVGPGPYWVTGTLDDYDAGGIVGPGSMISIESAVDGGFVVPAANKLSYAPRAYQVNHNIQVNLTIPRDGGLPIDLVTCR